jgi:hypothetical protein
MIRSLLVALTLLCTPLAGAADETFDPKKCHATFWDEDAEPAAKAPPEGFTEELLRGSLAVTGGVCGWAVKPWGRQPLYVAVVEQLHSISIGIFESPGPTGLRARGRLMLATRRGGEPHFHHFDFAPYRIDSDELAIGFRTANSVAYAGGGGRCQSLSLLRLQDERLSLILHTQMDYSAMVRGDPVSDEVPYSVYDVAAKATLSVSDQRTSGFFDLVKSIEFDNAIEDREDIDVVYAWNGERYEAKGDAPPLEANCLMPGFDLGEGQTETFPRWERY